MITLKYRKSGNAVFISHIDTLRGMVRAIRRAEINMAYSKGFNPHMLLFFSPPLALGISSEAEYVTADCTGMTPEEFLEAYNKACAPGFEGIECFETEKSPNLAGKIVSAEYFLPCADVEKAATAAKEVAGRTVYEATYLVKGKPETKDVRPLIHAVSAVENGLVVKLATGNTNLRADRLVNALNADFGLDVLLTDVVKTAQFVCPNGKITNADDYLKNFGETTK